ncbi:uncharacterized protein LOC119728954 [Patiria miniata]|uniref:Ig-like domain-containing protein n=1 Tax=Patiria miniata TaxID=46514 RepID=A0A914A1V8_PATMI|nr:uncharacterized protein LOC119728954 [Patiria miniata]
MLTTFCALSRPKLKSRVWIWTFLFAATFIRVNLANQFKEAIWLTPQESSIDMQCKADLLKRYQPQITTSWFKDDTVVVPTARLELDHLDTLRITGPVPEDHGLYACRVSYWDTVVTTNEIRVHAGLPGRTLGESSIWIAQNNDIVGVSNVWAISIMSTTVIGIIWLFIVVILRLKRCRCCGKDYELLASGAN